MTDCTETLISDEEIEALLAEDAEAKAARMREALIAVARRSWSMYELPKETQQ